MGGVAVFFHFLWCLCTKIYFIVPKMKNAEDNYVYKGDWKELSDVEMKKLLD